MNVMTEEQNNTALAEGVNIIKGHVKHLSATPGVYRMLDESGDVLYVGKAKSLKSRVASYTNPNGVSYRIARMIAETRDMMFVHTHTEAEALLLESNLIKKLKPKYNILLRDDKSFPYVLITEDHDFPLLTKHRGAQKIKGSYFGPFANAGAVNRTIGFLQKAFMIRNCSDNVFAGRARPCLQYHIKRCTAPCVGYVSKEEYAEQIRHVKEFMSGESRAIQDEYAAKMQAASDALDYEQAAKYRDRIKAMAALQGRQDIHIQGLKDCDVVCLVRKEGRACIQVFFFRAGQNYGNKAYFPRHSDDDPDGDILASFLAQFYESRPVPPDILVNMMPSEHTLLEDAFNSRQDTMRKVSITTAQRGKKRRVIDFVLKNCEDALDRELLRVTSEKKIMDALVDLFELENVPSRIEVYDNSHVSGTNMVGAMVVAGPDGFQKNAYRKFNIRSADASDDYGMMREVIMRRFSRAIKEGHSKEKGIWPDLLLIDGGLGQLNAVHEVLEDLNIADDLVVVAIAKGVDRHAGRERFFMKGRDEFTLPPNDAVMHYLQRLRDEAHRYAIGVHRARRDKEMKGSALDHIPGVGGKRKKALLLYFGSVKNVETAALADLKKVEGISDSLAEIIYGYFHEN
jgi:excinuclease ABC subunit C